MLVLGVDIGGTFTDLVLLDPARGHISISKTLTTPSDPSLGVMDGLHRLLAAGGFRLEEVRKLSHATTLATNAVIERKGAETGLLTTAGFRDVLEIGREVRYDLYDLNLRLPTPLVPRNHRFNIIERVDHEGRILVPLSPESVQAATTSLINEGVRAIAICFLHSYVNPRHEREAREIVMAIRPELSVSISSEIAAEIREYERTSTTVINAYVQPLVAAYLKRLEDQLRAVGFRGSMFIMLSNGGISTVRSAREFPTRLIESGPAAGALVAGFYGQQVGADNLLAFDMGGTTAKLCLVEHGQPTLTSTFEVARVHRFKKGSGFPVRGQAIDLIEIGAGGGSIARIDELGLLQVGPESAGAEPGPACYGKGGLNPTVTDADLVLGYLNPEYFLGGEMRLDLGEARTAIKGELCEPLAVTEVQAAWGIHNLVNENMASAARVHIAEKGRDPRQFVLVATGGAGPVHAYRVAEKLGIRRLVAPLGAGVASTIGLLVAPPRMDFVRTYSTRLSEADWGCVNTIFEDLEAEGCTRLAEAGVAEGDMRLIRTADMRYVGQGREVSVPIPAGKLGSACAVTIVEEFTNTYRELYYRTIERLEIEALNWRLTALGRSSSVQMPKGAPDSRSAGGHKGMRDAYLPEIDGFQAVPVYDRYQLRPGQRMVGPAIIEERESTLVIGVGGEVMVDDHRNIIVTVPAPVEQTDNVVHSSAAAQRR